MTTTAAADGLFPRNPAAGADIFKTGLIVADIDRAMADLGAALNLDWTEPRSVALTLATPAGRERTELVFSCARQGSSVLELIEANPDGYYQLRPGEALHHVGIWADDLTDASRRLAARGMPLEAAGVEGGRTPALFAFHTNPYGLRIELVDAAMRPSFTAWLAGGELAL